MKNNAITEKSMEEAIKQYNLIVQDLSTLQQQGAQLEQERLKLLGRIEMMQEILGKVTPDGATQIPQKQK